MYQDQLEEKLLNQLCNMKEQALPMLSQDIEVTGIKLINGVFEVLSHMPPIILVAGAAWIIWQGRSKAKG
jgi:hypothetical protein